MTQLRQNSNFRKSRKSRSSRGSVSTVPLEEDKKSNSDKMRMQEVKLKLAKGIKANLS
jgi:hypothetical protein